jgi:transposase
MGRVNRPLLIPEQRKELERGIKDGASHSIRMRCQCILLKSEGRSSKDAGSITGMCNVSVDNWVKRYNREGIAGLQTKPGRGRRPIIDEQTDKESVLISVKSNRQRMQTAKAEWEQQSGKKVCINTFKRFLKSLADDINE